MALELIKPFTTWLHLHPHWTGFFVGVLAFAESFALIGSIIPGSVTLTAIGVLIGSGVIPVTETFIWSIIGAILGDGISYWLGYHYREHLRDVWPFRKHPGILKKGETFFNAHGGKSVFIGRFVGPIRAILPLVAGMLKMPPRRFFFADVLSGILWAPSYMLPGILIGATALELAPQTATKFIFTILVTLLIIWILVYGLQYVTAWLLKKINTFIDFLWVKMQTHKSTRPLTIALHNPQAPEDHKQLVFLLLLIIMVSLFTILSVNVSHHGILTAANETVLHLLQGLRGGFLDNLMNAVTMIGEKQIMLIMLVTVFAWLIYEKYWRAALYWFVNGALASEAIWFLKNFINSARPTGIMVIPASPSFPSGHTTLSTAVLGFFAVLLAAEVKKGKRWLIVVPAGLIIITIGFSRLYLGAHWFTDVIGGFLLGLSFVTLSTLAYRRQLLNKISFSGLFATGVLTIAVCYSWVLVHQFSSERQKHMPYWPIQTIQHANWWQQNKPLLPLYRKNRLGQSIETLNLQWSAPLEEIRTQLSKHGWQEAPETDFTVLLHRLAAEDKTQVLPVLASLYQNKKPMLIMTKDTDAKKPILVLELWTSGVEFEQRTTPLWIGAVHYRVLWHHRWLPQHFIFLLHSPLDILKLALTEFKWQEKSYKVDNKEKVKLLLIKR